MRAGLVLDDVSGDGAGRHRERTGQVHLSGAAAAGLSDLLTNRFTLPGTDTAKAEAVLEDHFGQQTTGTFTVVVETRPGAALGVLPQARAAAARAAAELPTSRLAGVRAVSDSVIAATIVHFPPWLPRRIAGSVVVVLVTCSIALAPVEQATARGFTSLCA